MKRTNNRLKDYLQRQGVTQKDLCAIWCIKPLQAHRRLSKPGNLTIEMLSDLAEGLELYPETILWYAWTAHMDQIKEMQTKIFEAFNTED